MKHLAHSLTLNGLIPEICAYLCCTGVVLRSLAYGVWCVVVGGNVDCFVKVVCKLGHYYLIEC